MTTKNSRSSAPEAGGGAEGAVEPRKLERVERAVRRAGRADSRTAYVRDVRGRDLLTADDEQRLARQLEKLESDAWQRLLAFAPATEHVLAIAERAVEQPLPRFEALRSAAAEVRAQPSSAARIRLSRAARDAAVGLRALDRDRERMNAVLAELRRIDAAGGEAAPFATGRPYAAFRAAVATPVRAAAETRNTFVEANLRLVLNVARKYAPRGGALEDLIQEGNLGLMKAVDRFEYRRGYRFSTYAGWWIRHTIARAVANKARTVRVPVHITQDSYRLKRLGQELSAQLGRAPTSDELANASGFSKERVDTLRTVGRGGEISLDKPIGEEEKQPRIEVFRDPNAEDESPVDRVAARVQKAQLAEVMEDLTEKEADIVRRRFGLGEREREWTLQEIADDYGLSRERIRQIQAAALAKLRRAMKARGEVPSRAA